MLKRLFVGLMLSASALEAQYMEKEVQFSNWTASSVDITVRVRNTQPLADAWRLFSITNIFVGYDGPMRSTCILHCGFSSPTRIWSGNVDQSPFQAGGMNVQYNTGVFGWMYGTSFMAAFGTQIPGSLIDGFGIIGCTRPTFLVGTMTFAGRTCMEEGLDGFFELTTRFSSTQVNVLSLTEQDFFTSADGRLVQMTTPEPSTYVLMAVGMAGLFAVRRRR